MEERPAFIKHYSQIQTKDDSHYQGSSELLSIGSPFGKTFGLKRVAIHHEVLPPGRRTSWPHAESTEDEFIYVIEGTPDVWIDGQTHSLRPGDGVGFPAGTGISHTFLNNTESEVRLLVVGDTNRDDNKIYYPLHPARREQIPDRWWQDVPSRPLGSHSGLPRQATQRLATPDDFIRYVIQLKKIAGVDPSEVQVRRHVAHLRELDRRGRLVLCGPFQDGDGGMIVLRANSLEEAKELANEDPLVKEKVRTVEVRAWKLSCEENNHLGRG
jgi:uncharacterized cupin superfamily protein/uncharacterized protein YciI